ncbi:hypothetical protein [Mycoplasma putrefaciens]|uniref:Uncharacterized protein n=2 Tax=Mycoplasma putrefaciens TaxID=2123 RepID=M9WGG3_9MOLU|nr:hypothetical protein [Mycoplasma putrefaciens]AEM68992.1 hypothetical protein MPUT_0653 [Mycoplasma putrefaciens KS1]AGJ90525.1 Hypothetical protein MPUT9231_0690 [Mycoplasma putrefaciens Mput9231]
MTNLDQLSETYPELLSKVFREVLLKNYFTIATCEPFSKGVLSKIFEKLDLDKKYFKGEYKGYSNNITSEFVKKEKDIIKKYERIRIKQTIKLAMMARKKMSSSMFFPTTIGIAITSYRQNDYDKFSNDCSYKESTQWDKYYIVISTPYKNIVIKSEPFPVGVRSKVIWSCVSQLTFKLYDIYRDWFE